MVVIFMLKNLEKLLEKEIKLLVLPEYSGILPNANRPRKRCVRVRSGSALSLNPPLSLYTFWIKTVR